MAINKSSTSILGLVIINGISESISLIFFKTSIPVISSRVLSQIIISTKYSCLFSKKLSIPSFPLEQTTTLLKNLYKIFEKCSLSSVLLSINKIFNFFRKLLLNI